jgi:uncharacterized protein (DUF885 family)
LKTPSYLIFFGSALVWYFEANAQTQNADAQLRAIYTEEWKWRLEQFPGLEGPTKPVADHLPKEDQATQHARLHYWEEVLHKLDGIPRTELSQEEQINYDVYRPEIGNFVADQKFRDYEMPANSDSAFWTDLGYTARRPFKSVTDYKNWIAQMRDIPRYFREQIANMRAGLARGLTPPRLTLQGREKSIATIAEAKPEDNLLYTPFREAMVGVETAEQGKLKTEAAGLFARSYSRLMQICSSFSVTNTFRTRARRSRRKSCPMAKLITARRFANSPRSIFPLKKFMPPA